MANMPGRNGVASSLHYPLPHASSPLTQAHLQQMLWQFAGSLAQPIPSPVDGFTGGFTSATLTAMAGGSLLEAIGLAPAGYRVRGVTSELVATFGTSGGLTALLLGDPVLNDRWGRQGSLTMGAMTSQLHARSDSEPIAGPGGYVLHVAVEGGTMDSIGQIRLTVFWERLAADAP